jgi:curved DNA-binding protein CbpA
MKRIIEYRKLFNITQDASLGEIKIIYRNLMKEHHPDKFTEGDERLAAAEIKSKQIIEAYHFLVSISPETHAMNAEEYTLTTSASGIDDLQYKGQTLKINFLDGSIYEYFAVPQNTYNKLTNSANLARFARRHIFHSYTYRKVSKSTPLS